MCTVRAAPIIMGVWSKEGDESGDLLGSRAAGRGTASYLLTYKSLSYATVARLPLGEAKVELTGSTRNFVVVTVIVGVFCIWFA